MAENLLKQRFNVYEPNAVRVSDITYVPTDEGWLYIAGHIDFGRGRGVKSALKVNKSSRKGVTAFEG